MSWSKSFRIPAGVSVDDAKSFIDSVEVDAQPGEGYDKDDHFNEVSHAQECAMVMVEVIGMRPGKEIAVSIGGHTPCGEKDWGGSMSISVCHVEPLKS